MARRSPELHDSTRPTSFRADEGRVSAALQVVGEREGTLVTPVSQLCTRQQTQEPIFAALLQQLGGAGQGSVVDQWEQAFLARVLDRYDAARSGARGLGIGAPHDRIAPWLARHGCSVLLTTVDEPPVDQTLTPQIEVKRLDPGSDGLAGFDFAWATRAGGPDGTDRQAVLRFIEDVVRALKPGGLFALVVPIDVAPRDIGDETGPVMRRPDIDRIVLLLLSRGHQVAQIRPWGQAVAVVSETGSPMMSAFGLVVRKAT